MAIDPALLTLVTESNLGVLVTLKRDGRPQLSNINYEYDADASRVRISVTEGRAKTANLRRDPRGSLYVTSADGWAYTVVEGDATLSEVASDPHDAAVDELVGLYRSIRGEDHPDWDKFRRAMVDEQRLVCRLHITHAYGVAQR